MIAAAAIDNLIQAGQVFFFFFLRPTGFLGDTGLRDGPEALLIHELLFEAGTRQIYKNTVACRPVCAEFVQAAKKNP